MFINEIFIHDFDNFVDARFCFKRVINFGLSAQEVTFLQVQKSPVKILVCLVVQSQGIIQLNT